MIEQEVIHKERAQQSEPELWHGASSVSQAGSLIGRKQKTGVQTGQLPPDTTSFALWLIGRLLWMAEMRELWFPETQLLCLLQLYSGRPFSLWVHKGKMHFII